MLQSEGFSLQGFDGLVHSTIPFGSEVSSSAALEVATAVLFVILGELEIDPVMIAKLSQRAENEFVGMNYGVLDQYSSMLGQEGGILLLDFAAALDKGDRGRIKELELVSFVGARDLYEISSPEMEHMMDAMMSAPGVVGARHPGAGFGGCMVAVIEENMAENFYKHVSKRYRELSGIEADVYPAKASAGAGVIKF